MCQTTTEFIVQLNCNHVEFKGLSRSDSSNLPKINLGMSLTESPWIKFTVQITDMLHPHCKLVPTVWLNFFSPSILPVLFFFFFCFPLAVLVAAIKVDLLRPDLDIRVRHHESEIKGDTGHFVPLQHYTHARANICAHAARTPQTFSSFTAGCLLAGGLAAAAHSRLFKVELCDY